MSDPTFSDIDFKKWNGLNYPLTENTKTAINRFVKIVYISAVAVRQWAKNSVLFGMMKDIKRFRPIFAAWDFLPFADSRYFFRPEGRSSRTFNQISREMIALKSNICLRSDQSSPKSVQSDQMESLADGHGKIPSSDPWSREWILLKFFFSMQRAKL